MRDIGRRVLGLSAIGMAAVSFVFHDFKPLWHPTPGHFPWLDLFAFAWDVVFVVAGLMTALGRRIANAGAIALAAAFLVRAAVLMLPPLAKAPGVWVNYETLAEATAMGVGAVLAWAMLGEGDARARAGMIARYVLGLCLVVFGISDAVYSKFTASLVPPWLPPSQLFWTYFATAAHIAAGLAVLSGIRARLAAVLVAVMYAIWQIIVHLRLVILEPHKAGHWSEFSANLVLLGAVWCLVEWLDRTRKAA